MNRADGRQKQASSPDIVRSEYSGPIFYNDEHAARLLKTGPRYVNVYLFPPTDRLMLSPAHGSRELADFMLSAPRRQKEPVYRIVVRLKEPRA